MYVRSPVVTERVDDETRRRYLEQRDERRARSALRPHSGSVLASQKRPPAVRVAEGLIHGGNP